ncbi:hypothetical protein K6T82_00500 [Flavobacterium sp. 17A]|uniref:Lipoprotein n=1 Tax=Flavobacterium potami TaxID=2872310 RepID=A0A9X1H770_9FLAO|nr:hypothetical protein [Flavobacterium potami]MBZ4033229.1 hypothetical protein [Flavobacterium potami]
MKNIFLLLFSTLLLFSSCHQPKPKKNVALNKEEYPHITDSSLKNDTISRINNVAENCPIKITKTTILLNGYSNHKDLKVVYKNSGKKIIKAIKFEWYCINAFEKPASGHYFYGEGNFKKDITEVIKPGQTKTEIWEDFSTDADKVIKINAYYIVYIDGTKWELNDSKIPL